MKIHEYFETYGCAVLSWAHMKLRCNQSLENVLLYVFANEIDVQILYANDCRVAKTKAFNHLLSVIQQRRVWAINLGEVEFSPEQCNSLTKALHNSAVAFMFVDAILVGSGHVRVWKNIIRKRRQNTMTARWLLSSNTTQNEIIYRCKNMWWSPLALGRNKKFKKSFG